jgi:hypothetical protein
VEVPPRTKTTTATKMAMVTLFFAGTKFRTLSVLPREQKFNKDHFLAMIAPELSKENTNPKWRVDKNQLVVRMDNFMCHNGCMIRDSFARKTLVRVPRPVYSPDLSPCDFRFVGHAKQRMKNKIITSEGDLEDMLTEV